jgi:membrane-associated phospholipid phosphatase
MFDTTINSKSVTVTVTDIFDYIGHYGPVILFVFTFYSLLYKSKYLFVYIIGIIMNSFLNIYLKQILKEPRPSNSKNFIDSEQLHGKNFYGLPSGHAQSVAFSLTFLYLTKGPIAFIYVMSCVAVITIYQRWKYRRHTGKQLIIGTIIGSLFAWVIYGYKKKFMTL